MGIPLALLLALIVTHSVGTTKPYLQPRTLQTTVATGTFAIETNPPSTIDTAVYLYRLQVEARFVERLIWAPGTLRRVAKQFDIPPNELLGTASAARKEQLPERSFGSRDQRSYTVVRQQTPYEVLSDGYLADPLVRVRVRAPSAKEAAEILEALPGAVNAQLSEIAGGESRLIVQNRSGAGVQTSGVPLWPSFVAIAIVSYLFWLALGGVRTSGRWRSRRNLER